VSGVCESGQCIDCSGYLDCGSVGSYCDTPTHKCSCGPSGCPDPLGCSSSTGCQSAQAPFCIAGKCSCGSLGPCSPPYVCLANDDSGTGARCSLPVGWPCLVDNDCAPNRCLNGICAFEKDPPCTQDKDCAVGACKAGHCRMYCRLAGDCATGTCVENHCTDPMLVGCARDNDCPTSAPTCCAGYAWTGPRCWTSSCD
jgi:hypothetical protein